MLTNNCPEIFNCKIPACICVHFKPFIDVVCILFVLTGASTFDKACIRVPVVSFIIIPYFKTLSLSLFFK